MYIAALFACQQFKVDINFLMNSRLQHKLHNNNTIDTIQINDATNRSVDEFVWDLVSPMNVQLGDPRDSVQNGSIPFYVYHGASFDWDTLCRNVTLEEDHSIEHHQYYKHGNDLWFAHHVAKHPWRVYEPSKAKLFVVPVLLSFISRQSRCGILKTKQLVTNIHGEIMQMPYYRRHNGSDHIFLGTDYKIAQRRSLKTLFPGAIWALQVHNWWRRLGGSCSFAIPMNSMVVGPDKLWSNSRNQSTEEWNARSHPLYFQGQIDSRPNYRARVLVGKALDVLQEQRPELLNGSIFAATPYEHDDIDKYGVRGLKVCNCPQKHGFVTPVASNNMTCLWCIHPLPPFEKRRSISLKERLAFNPYASDLPASKFAVHIKGDLPGSNRIYDIIKAGAIPIMVGDQIKTTLPFPDIVPWENMTFQIRESKVSPQTFKAILESSQAELDLKRAAIKKFAPDILWDIHGSRVTTNVLLFAAKHCLGLDTARTSRSSIPYKPQWKHRNLS